jgi:Mg2+ and Co2+ transporter CorA
LIWSDSGDDDCKDCIPTPSTEHFKEALNNVEFCPIFFEKGLVETTLKPLEAQSPRGRQPFSALPSKYGETLDWSKAHLTPLYALEELLHFQATSMSQYLNLLERVISKHLPTVEHPELVQTKIEDILHFEYAKTVLVRHSAYVRETIDFVKGPLHNWNTEKTNDLDFSQPVSTVEGDFRYLLDRIQSLVEFCEAGKSSIMSNTAIAESRQANDEAKLVTQLTKATNRVTFIFLPISFVTSVFGMNFRQFGQGNLTILWWVAITLPLLAVSVLLVERWNVLQGWVRGVPKWLSHKER